jgi:hypothetical protein
VSGIPHSCVPVCLWYPKLLSDSSVIFLVATSCSCVMLCVRHLPRRSVLCVLCVSCVCVISLAACVSVSGMALLLLIPRLRRCSARKLPCLSGDFWRGLGGGWRSSDSWPTPPGSCIQDLPHGDWRVCVWCWRFSVCVLVPSSRFGVPCACWRSVAGWRCRLEKLDELCMGNERMGNERIDTTTHTHTHRLEKLDELCMATERIRLAQEGEEIDEMNRVHVLLPGQEVEKGSLLYFEGKEARSQMERAKGQFKYLSNLVAAQEAAAKRKRDAAAAAALARRGGGGGAPAAPFLPADEAAAYTGKEAHMGHAAAIDGLPRPAAAIDGLPGHAAAIDGLHSERQDGRGVINVFQDDVFTSSEVMMCPVCTDDVGTSSGASVMLPCGHLLCYPCCKDLLKVLRQPFPPSLFPLPSCLLPSPLVALGRRLFVCMYYCVCVKMTHGT